VGARLAAGVAAMPVPPRLTVCGLPVALSVMEIVPVSAPSAVGVNVTLMAQFAPAARLEPQLLVCAKLALAEMLVMLKLAVPPFVSVIGWLALEVFKT
jgi:hypothetical protein